VTRGRGVGGSDSGGKGTWWVSQKEKRRFPPNSSPDNEREIILRKPYDRGEVSSRVEFEGREIAYPFPCQGGETQRYLHEEEQKLPLSRKKGKGTRKYLRGDIAPEKEGPMSLSMGKWRIVMPEERPSMA